MIYAEVLNFISTLTGEQYLPALAHEADQDKMLCLFMANNVTSSNGAHATTMFGAAGGDLGGFIANRSATSTSRDNRATTVSYVTQQQYHCIWMIDETGVTSARAYLNRLEDNQLVIDHQVDPNNKLMTCLCIYGPGVESAMVGAFVLDSALGTYSVDVGFPMRDGDLVLLFKSRNNSADDSSMILGDINFCLGMANSTSDQGYVGAFSDEGTTTANLNATRQITGKLLGIFDTTTLYEEIQFAGFTDIGFDYEITTSSGGGEYIYYAVLRGAKSKVASYNIPNPGIGDNSYSGLDFYPKALLTLGNTLNPSSSTRVNRADIGMGVGVSNLSDGQGGYTSVLAGTINTRSDSGSQKQVLLMGSHDISGNYTTRRNANLKAQTLYTNPGSPDGGFTLNVAQNGTSLEFFGLAIGDEPASVNVKGANMLGANACHA